MIETFRLILAPLTATIATLWAALLALAAEVDATSIDDDRLRGAGDLAVSRALHVGHLALLIVAGATAAGASAWWLWQPLAAVPRLIAAIGLVWIVADLLPRVVAVIAPELPTTAHSVAVSTLRFFAPLLRLVAWADSRSRPTATGSTLRTSGAATPREMLLGIFSLGDLSVAEVMTPRIDIIAVDVASTWDDVVATLQRSEHARLLVYDGHPDSVAGVLYAKDMLAAMTDASNDHNWLALVRSVPFVPEGKTLDRQLRDFQRGPAHLAVVVDEFGGTAGLVTLEDILEQIVGEIQDERDTDEAAPIQTLADGALRVDGGAPLSSLEEALDLRIDREDVSTVGGWVLAEFGRVPRNGESLTVHGIELLVELVVRRRVRSVRVRSVVAARGAAAAEPEGDE